MKAEEWEELAANRIKKILDVDTHGQSPWHFTSLRDEKTQAALDLNPGGLATEHMTISLSHQALLSIRNTLVTI